MQGHYTYANKKVCELFGLSLKEIIGKSDENFFSLEQSNDLRENDLSVIETGMSLIKEERNVISSTGEARFYISEKKPLLDSDGLIIGLFGISTDVTDEKRLSKALAQSDSR